DDRARRRVPHTRGPPARLGAQQMIPDPGRLALFVVAAPPPLVVPGPAVLYVVTRSLHHGRRAGLASVLGIHTGTLAHTAAGTAGGLLRGSRRFLRVQRHVAGSVYLGLGVATALAGSKD